MSTPQNSASPAKPHLLSLDTWAVIAALVLALAVRFDLLKNVPW
ncbi:MAG TPA: hypothetical protein VK828_12550 [Terriglobales bacterium]|nr:hypothetical protein [Terriglobales bacterium]